MKTLVSILIFAAVFLSGCRHGMSENALIIEDNPKLFDRKGKLLQQVGMLGPEGKFVKILPIKIKGAVAEAFYIKTKAGASKPIVLQLYRGNHGTVEKNHRIGAFQIGKIEDYKTDLSLKVVLGIKERVLLMEATEQNSKKLLSLVKLDDSELPVQAKPDDSELPVQAKPEAAETVSATKK